VRLQVVAEARRLPPDDSAQYRRPSGQQDRQNDGRTTVWALLLLLTGCLILRTVALVRPCLSDDEATYCVVGREMLAGRVLYKDVVDHKPPLIYLTYAVTQKLGGAVGGMRLLHLLTILVVFATGLLLGRIARRMAFERGDLRAVEPESFAAAALYIVFSTTLFDFDSLAANCELFMLLPLTGSVVLYLRSAVPDLHRAGLFAAGVLVGVAMLYKYQAGVQIPLALLHLALVHRRRPGRVFQGWLVLLAGVLAVLAACALVMVRIGDLADAWFWFRFNFAYIREGLAVSEVAGRAVVRLSYAVFPALLLWMLGVRAAVRALRPHPVPPRPGALDPFVAGWLVVSALATTVGGRFFGHYFYQVIAPLAVLAAPAMSRLWVSSRRLVVAGAALPAAVFFFIGVFHGPVMAALGQAEPDYPAIAAFVDAHCRPEDRLVIWGNAPVLYFEANRPLGSRFAFSNYLTGLSPATRTQSDPKADSSANIVDGSWDMFESDLEERRPRLFVDTSPGDIGSYGKFPPAKYPRLKAILDRDYVSIGEVAGARVFARRGR
jgi:4-amino-4-deoxy-L-arabinose transferase-like glycosyltransferase